MQVEVFNKLGQSVGHIEINDGIFAVEPNEDAMHLAVVSYLSNQRLGTHKTKIRSEVSGGGKKPWKQKGRGTARSGSTRSPVWVGGGTVFGPKPHLYKKKITKQVSKLARRSALSLRATESSIVIVEDFNLEKPKTKEMATLINSLKLNNKTTLVVLPEYSDPMYKSVRNIEKLDITPAEQISAYDILSHKKLVIFKGAVSKLEQLLAI